MAWIENKEQKRNGIKRSQRLLEEGAKERRWELEGGGVEGGDGGN